MNLPDFESKTTRDVLRLLIDELDDYSTDQRGDVGSWVRMSCVSGLVTVSRVMLETFHSPSELAEFLPPETFHAAVGGILKQGVERLDNVRQLVGKELANLVSCSKALKEDFQIWRIHGMEIISPLFSE